LSSIEQEIATFKKVNQAALPELNQFNLADLQRTSVELETLEARLASIARRVTDIDVHRAQITPWKELLDSNGAPLMSDQESLYALQTEYRQKRSQLQDTHPDLINLRQKIEYLESAVGARSDATGAGQRVPDNPAYLVLESQRETLLAEQTSLKQQAEVAKRRLGDLQQILAISPNVEREYLALQRRYQDIKTRYQDIVAKESAVELSERVELEQEGGRFELLEPADLPEVRSSPNRTALLAVGLMLSAAAGLALVAMLEVLDRKIYDEKQLEAVTNEPPFAVVPYIVNSIDYEKPSGVKLGLILGGCTLIFVLIALNYVLLNTNG
jgi:hypothetical protein